jgi:phage baseplate assembly protein W
VKTLTLSNTLLDQQVLGIGLASPLVTDSYTKDFLGVSGEDNVTQCIEDLLGTRVGERVMNEDLGTLFPQALFENSTGLLKVLPVQAMQAITMFEPRVKNVKSSATIEGNVIYVDVSWTVKATGARGNYVYPFYLQNNSGGVTGQ